MIHRNEFWVLLPLRQRYSSAPRGISSACVPLFLRSPCSGLGCGTACANNPRGNYKASAAGHGKQPNVRPVITTIATHSTPVPQNPSNRWLTGAPVLLLCALFFTALSACTTHPEAKEHGAKGTPQASQQRIVTLGGAATEIVYALGVGQSIVGTDLSSTYPTATHSIPKVGYWRTLSAEGVLSLRPTVVIADYGSGPEGALQALEASGIAVHRLPEVLSIEQGKEKVQRIASILHREQQATALLAAMEQQYTRAIALVQSYSSQPRTLFLYIRGTATMNAGGKSTPANAMVRLAGGTNVASMLDGWKPVSAEFFVQTQPDILIVTTSGLQSIGGMEAVKRVPGLSTTPAMRANRVVVVDDLAFLGFGPRMPEALHQIARAYADFIQEHIAPTTGAKP